MGLLRVLVVGLLLAAQPTQAVLGILCRDGVRHQVGHCTVQVEWNTSVLGAAAGSDLTGCLTMPACREPAPLFLGSNGDLNTTHNPSKTLIPGVGALDSVPWDRPPTPPPNG